MARQSFDFALPTELKGYLDTKDELAEISEIATYSEFQQYWLNKFNIFKSGSQFKKNIIHQLNNAIFQCVFLTSQGYLPPLHRPHRPPHRTHVHQQIRKTLLHLHQVRQRTPGLPNQLQKTQGHWLGGRKSRIAQTIPWHDKLHSNYFKAHYSLHLPEGLHDFLVQPLNNSHLQTVLVR